MKSLPIGIENFKDVITNCYYIDKTKFIKEICELPPTSAILFVRPSRFGKTLTLSMLQTFFEKNDNDNPAAYFENLEISKHRNITEKFMGKFSCIYLNMKDVFSSSYQETFKKAVYIVVEEVMRHKHILKNLDTDEKNEYNSLLNYNMNEVLFTSSVKKLSLLIEKSTGLRPVLLIDEYDSPIQSSYKFDFFENIVLLFKRFYGETLKGNPHIYLSVISGITRSAKTSLFSGVNNLIVNTVIEKQYDSFFGFTTDEVKILCDKTHKKFENSIIDWYGNYKFGNSYLLNPWSVMCYLSSDKEYKTYWANTTSISIIELIISKNNLNMMSEINNLLNGKCIISDVDKNVNYEGLNTKDSIFSFLLFMGYLSVSDEIDESTYRLKIPNIEIRKVFLNEIKDLLKKQNSLIDAYEIKDYFLSGDSLSFCKAIENNILNSFSYFEIKDERAYQIMMLTLFSILLDDSIIKSEVPAGTGRCDIMIAPKKENGFGAIIEIKYLKSKTSSERMKVCAENSLNQIEGKEYYKAITEYLPGKLYIYGFCFSNNKVVSSCKKII